MSPTTLKGKFQFIQKVLKNGLMAHVYCTFRYAMTIECDGSFVDRHSFGAGSFLTNKLRASIRGFTCTCSAVRNIRNSWPPMC